MRTACLLPVSPSMHCAGRVSAPGGCLLPGVSAWGVSAPEGVSAPGGVCSHWGCLLPLGISGPGGLLLGVMSGSRGMSPRGLSAPGREFVSQHALRQTPPPVDRITDRCKNITFANFVCGR